MKAGSGQCRKCDLASEGGTALIKYRILSALGHHVGREVLCMSCRNCSTTWDVGRLQQGTAPCWFGWRDNCKLSRRPDPRYRPLGESTLQLCAGGVEDSAVKPPRPQWANEMLRVPISWPLEPDGTASSLAKSGTILNVYQIVSVCSIPVSVRCQCPESSTFAKNPSFICSDCSRTSCVPSPFDATRRPIEDFLVIFSKNSWVQRGNTTMFSPCELGG